MSALRPSSSNEPKSSQSTPERRSKQSLWKRAGSVIHAPFGLEYHRRCGENVRDGLVSDTPVFVAWNPV